MRSRPRFAVVALTTPMVLALTVIMITLLGAPSAQAQFAGADTLYAGGALGFSYRQTPFPFYSGVLDIEGDAFLPDGGWNPDQTEAVGGGMGMMTPDSVATGVYAVRDNGNQTYDVGLAVLRTLGPLQPGVYPIDIQAGTAAFFFIDDAATVALPDTLDAAALIAWFMDLPAAHKFVSLTGNLSVSVVSADTLAGTFTGTATDIDNLAFLINVTGGRFALRGLDTTLPVSELVSLQPTVRVAPNPFNPRTEIGFSLPIAQHVGVQVYDLGGRRVRTLHDGVLAAGPQKLSWDGRGERGNAVGAGVYLVKVTGAGWQHSARMTYLP